MEQITQGKLKILKGESSITISKTDTTLKDWNEDLWSFVDGLIGKGYEIISINTQGMIIFVMLKK
ncbi:hypothetical protein HN615_09300 [Candidatus Woesearchaeota archaeon]|jgi:hypothetical protein|nr:hypothetical protein [Candidatus Woesearchaeota archaeon]